MPSLNETLSGREYWRSLEHLANTPEVREGFAQEFPGYDPDELSGSGKASGGFTRRSFLQIMGAAMGLAGLTLTGCRRWPEQEIRAHTMQPENTRPGTPLYYATMMELSGVASGLLVKSYDGRPIKIEGNSLHPYSLGAAGVFSQASILDMYDPARSRRAIELSEKQSSQRSWDEAAAFLKKHFATFNDTQGKGLAVLIEPTSSLSVERLRKQFAKQYPQATWHVYEPLHRDYEILGSVLAFGKPLRAHYKLNEAKVIACFDADPLGLHPAHQKHARDWAVGRLSADEGTMNRLYAVEAHLSTTGAAADHRLPVKSSDVGAYLLALAEELGVTTGSTIGSLPATHASVIKALANDLKSAHGQGVVIVGPAQPATVHALAHAINTHLSHVGKTVVFTAETNTVSNIESLKQLTALASGGSVQTLLVLGGNPVFDAPGDLKFASALQKVKTVIHLSHEMNETSQLATWHLPRAHYLESWGDGRAWDGSISVQQPLILPLFEGKSIIEVLATALDLSSAAGLDLVRDTFATLLPAGPAGEAAWRQILHDGLLEDSALAIIEPGKAKLPALDILPTLGKKSDAMEITFIGDLSLYDGRFANNGWLQEMPDPISKLTWDNAAQLSKADADKLGVTTGDMIQIEAAGQTLEIVVYVQPGLANGTIVLALGYGRKICGAVGANVGFDVNPLRTSSNGFITPVTAVKPTGKTYKLASTQVHHLIDAIGVYGREKRVGEKSQSGMIIHEATLAEYQNDKKLFQRNEHGDVPLQLFDPPSNFADPHAWAMTIDMNSCIGCHACVVACQSENNVPIVGKEQVLNHREMHWLRIDRYYKGDVEKPETIDTVYQPMACTHCENAPCEQVCPVAATMHDSEGLNTMVYNRCIGTRYCSNNCPYKVRRFNYFDYHSKDPHGIALPYPDVPDTQQNNTIDPIKRMVFNPDVTVRMRGVMEKCTYCVQRISGAKIAAKIAYANGERDTDLVKDGEILTACQTSCPTQAITFGNLNDPSSKVTGLQKNNRAYAVLGELNIRPRTRYLAKIRNTAPELSSASHTHHASLTGGQSSAQV